jgi:hypothetical protein
MTNLMPNICVYNMHEYTLLDVLQAEGDFPYMEVSYGSYLSDPCWYHNIHMMTHHYPIYK